MKPLFLHTQRGNLALPLLALSFATAAGLSFALISGAEHESEQMAALKRARDALIARAATDDNRPGSLPCPDLLTDSSTLANIPDDGKADLLTRNRCPSYLGRLPWATLDMPKARDQAGEALWYLAAPGLRDDESAQPINSDTASGLEISSNPDIAALLIAPGTPLPGQQRPSNTIADYLEGQFSDDPPHYTTAGNDRILPISRQELMAAAEQRVAASVRHCLARHARLLGHFPWPSPLAASGGEGHAHSLFGRLPLTQPNSGIQEALRTQQSALGDELDQIANTSGVEQSERLQMLAERVGYGDRLVASLETANAQISERAANLAEAMTELEASIRSATANSRIARSEGITITSEANATLSTVDALEDAIFRFGLDTLAWRSAEPSPANNRTQNALLAARAQLHQALQAFIVLDTATPRPLQAALVAPAEAIGSPIGDFRQITNRIAEQATTLRDIAQETRQRATTAQTALDNAISTQKSWTNNPSSDKRSALDRALDGAIAATQALIDANGTLRDESSGGTAQAWPMVWAAQGCEFLAPSGPSWWQANQWHPLVFYQIARQTPDPRLQLPGKPAQSLIVLLAGQALDGQRRPSTDIADYLESANANPSRNGEALSPSLNFVQARPGLDFNDQVAY